MERKRRKGKRKTAATAAVTVSLMSVPAGGRHYFGLGPRASYEAAKRGELVTIKIGNKIKVSVAAMERRLQDLAERALENIRARDQAPR